MKQNELSIRKRLFSKQNIYLALYSVESYISNRELLDKRDKEELNRLKDKFDEENIEKWIERAGTTLRSPIERIFPAQSSASVGAEDFMNQFIAVLILFCASGTGIFGALTEGMTGDPTILLTKSILDFFTAAIFASTLGYIITVIFIPQLIVFVILFFAATFIMALINPSMIADFTACGGIIMLATGFRLCGIRAFPTANMLPSLILVMPFSAAWQQFIA